MGAVHAAQGDPARSDRETHSLPDTAWLATYSSLRRKKSTRQAGEMRHNARRFSALLVRAELFLIHYWGQGTYGSLASLPQTEERA